jgi:predicted HD phosphohydrolase
MTEGTKSYLFGCHQFLIHPLCVLFAWVKIYRRCPEPWQVVCIFLHDIGHIGKQYLSNYEDKKNHWFLGAQIAGMLFGAKGILFVAGHTKQSRYSRSALFLPDKVSWLIAPRWWLRSNRLIEKQLSVISTEEFQRNVADNIRNGCRRGTHDIYLDYSARSIREIKERVK